MGLFGTKMERCMWLADLQSWPNPDSPNGQARRERCFDQHMSRVAGTAMPNVGIQHRGSMVRPPQPAPSSGAGNPDNKVMSEVAIVAIVAMLILLIYKM